MNRLDVVQLHWRPGIGDPTVMGWLTVAAYGLAAAACFIAASRDQAGDPREVRIRRRMWLAIGLMMSFLCVNKQLDLQTLLTDIGRVLAARGGWYAQRRTVQRWFVVAIMGAGAAAIGYVVWKIRKVLGERVLVPIGLCALVTFVVIRAASFHHVDVLLMSRIIGVRMNWILELGGIALVGLGALRACRQGQERIGKRPGT